MTAPTGTPQIEALRFYAAPKNWGPVADYADGYWYMSGRPWMRAYAALKDAGVEVSVLAEPEQDAPERAGEELADALAAACDHAEEMKRERDELQLRLSEAAPRWIPVSERLPADDRRVLTYATPTAEMLALRAEIEPSAGHTKEQAIDAIAAYDWQIAQWITFDGMSWWSPDSSNPPTHWMPLPEGPKS